MPAKSNKPKHKSSSYMSVVSKSPVPNAWSPDFDLSTIPDHILHTESARRRRATQIEPPRPQIKRPCRFCQELFGARDMRKHQPICPRRHDKQPAIRPGWTLERVIDPEEQQRQTYRYWHSRPVGERLTAVWEATEAAYSIQRVGPAWHSQKTSET